MKIRDILMAVPIWFISAFMIFILISGNEINIPFIAVLVFFDIAAPLVARYNRRLRKKKMEKYYDDKEMGRKENYGELTRKIRNFKDVKEMLIDTKELMFGKESKEK